MHISIQIWLITLSSGGMGVIGIRQKMGLRLVENGFSSFYAKFFATFNDLAKFPSSSTFDVLHFAKSSNMAKIWRKNEEKPC